MIRLAATSPQGFRHGGLVVGSSWTGFDRMTPDQIATMRDFHGKFLRVHPEDVVKLGAVGLAFKGAGEPLKSVEKSNNKNTGIGAGKDR